MLAANDVSHLAQLEELLVTVYVLTLHWFLKTAWNLISSRL